MHYFLIRFGIVVMNELAVISCPLKLRQFHTFSWKRPKTVKRHIEYWPQRFYSEEWDYDVDTVLKDDTFKEFSDRMFRLPQHGHKVLVIQPFIKNWSKSESRNVQEQKEANTTPALQLEEAISLINTLPRWKTVESRLISVPNFKKQSFFGPGQIDKLKEILNSKKDISAVFVSVNILRVKQIIQLEEALKVPVFDRYTIVIQIFRHHAVTNESKLQVAMAEIPYLKQCVKGLPLGLSDRLTSASNIGGTEHTLAETRRELLTQREQKLKKALSVLRKHRERLRNNPRKKSYPIVAVMGYTNAGKTSLIKALTGANKLKPRDQLFATLDVTKHEGVFPCNMKVLFVDTVGFITDIPTELLESFTATLEDAVYSDIIIHVWDVSNPDFRKQRDHVMSTLACLNFGKNLEEKSCVIGNKVDRISKDALAELKRAEPAVSFVSAKTGYGMEEMLHSLQEKVIKVTDRVRMKIRVKTGGEEYRWLCEEFPVEDLQLEKDPTYTMFTVVITKSQFEIFKHKVLST